MTRKRGARTKSALPDSAEEAVAWQNEMRHCVIRASSVSKVSVVAGADVSARGDRVRGAVVTLGYPDLEPIEDATAVMPARFPYVPGLLAFREAPVLIEAFRRLKTTPDLLIVDGQGLAHPRRFGLACHLGVELDLPAIGCAKSRLIGEHKNPGSRKGARVDLLHKGEVIGRVVRTREGVKPVYVSIGHRVDLDTAVRFTLLLCERYKLPEPIRHAHRAAGQW